MITSNGGESRIKETGNNKVKRENKNYSGERRFGDRNSKSENQGQREFKGNSGSGFKRQESGDGKKGFGDNKNARPNFNRRREDGADSKSDNRNSFNRNGDTRQGGGKFNGNRDNASKGYKKNFGSGGYGNPYDKDSDEELKPSQRPRQQNKDKAKEQQPDKMDIKNRFEREKKAMQKKQSERKQKSARVQSKPKRTNNIDWTREYENGSYDDDDLDMYL